MSNLLTAAQQAIEKLKSIHYGEWAEDEIRFAIDVLEAAIKAEQDAAQTSGVPCPSTP